MCCSVSFCGNGQRFRIVMELGNGCSEILAQNMKLWIILIGGGGKEHHLKSEMQRNTMTSSGGVVKKVYSWVVP